MIVDDDEAMFKIYFLNIFISLHYRSFYKFDDQFLPFTSDLNIFMGFHVHLCKIIYLYLLEPNNVDLKKIKNFRKNARNMEPYKSKNLLLDSYYKSFDELLVFIEKNY